MGLYESLALVVANMVRPENPNILQIGGSIWLLQLWLNDTFESPLKARVLLNLKEGIERLRLAKLTPKTGKVIPLEIFKDYFQIFYICKTFTELMVPFTSQQYGPD